MSRFLFELSFNWSKFCRICKSLRIDSKACSQLTSEIIDYSKFELRHSKMTRDGGAFLISGAILIICV